MKNFINRVDAAKMAGVCTKLIAELIKNDGFPKPVLVGKANRWVDTEVQRWIEHKIAERDSLIASENGNNINGEVAK